MKIIIPYINPIKLQKLTPDEVPQYLSRHMDDWMYYDTLDYWMEPTHYCQLFQNSDTLKTQVQSTFDAHLATIINHRGRVFATLDMVQGAESATEAGLFLYEINYPLTDLPKGQYYVQIVCGAGSEMTLISEPIFIAPVIENSLLLEYSNSRFYNGLLFETGIGSLAIRVQGKNRFKTPASKDTFYEDQVLDLTLLNSVSYRVFELLINGIPDYLVDKVNRILGCDTLRIDGRYFTKAEGAKLEEKAFEDYPLRGWSIELRESSNEVALTLIPGVAIPGGTTGGGGGSTDLIITNDGFTLITNDNYNLTHG